MMITVSAAGQKTWKDVKDNVCHEISYDERQLVKDWTISDISSNETSQKSWGKQKPKYKLHPANKEKHEWSELIECTV
jgi:hypothetical protein